MTVASAAPTPLPHSDRRYNVGEDVLERARRKMREREAAMPALDASINRNLNIFIQVGTRNYRCTL